MSAATMSQNSISANVAGQQPGRWGVGLYSSILSLYRSVRYNPPSTTTKRSRGYCSRNRTHSRDSQNP